MSFVSSIIPQKHRFIRFNNKHRVFISKNYQDVKSGLSKYYAPVEPVANKAVKHSQELQRAKRDVLTRHDAVCGDLEQGISLEDLEQSDAIRAEDREAPVVKSVALDSGMSAEEIANFNMAKVREQFPSVCWAGDDKWSSRLEVKREAMGLDYCNLNESGHWRYIILDFDIDFYTFKNELLSTGVPMPNFCVIDDSLSGGTRGQAFWRLDVSINAGNPKSARYARDVQRSLSVRLSCDLGFSGGYTKNVFSKRWRVEHFRAAGHRLSDFKEFMIKRPVRGVGGDLGVGRNTGNFYFCMVECSSYAEQILAMGEGDALRAIQDVYDSYNAIHTEPLPEREALSSIRSVYRQLARGVRYYGARKRVMPEEKLNGLSGRERMAAGGVYGCAQRKLNKNRAISQAFDNLSIKGIKPSNRKLAQEAGVSVPTVIRWKRERVEVVRIAEPVAQAVKVAEALEAGQSLLGCADLGMIDQLDGVVKQRCGDSHLIKFNNNNIKLKRYRKLIKQEINNNEINREDYYEFLEPLDYQRLAFLRWQSALRH